MQTDMALQPMAIAAGPLVGTGFPMGTRTAVSARNQINGGFSFSNVGGDFGTRLKMAGYDAVLIEGASCSPVYLLITSTKIEFLPADEVWGMKTCEFLDFLHQRYENQPFSYIGIGPAGENQVAISCLMVDQGHAAGWGGSGAIFGAKQLKAIVVIGDQPVPVFDEQGFLEKINQMNWRIGASEAMSGLIRGGTHGMAGAGGFTGLVPNAVKNLTDEYLPPEQTASIKEEALKPWQSTRSGCFDCKINCLHKYDKPTKQYGLIKTEGLHANSVRGLASNWGISDPESLLAAHSMCNDYGLDVDGISAVIAFAMECFEHGVLSQDQIGGYPLGWGNGPSAVKLVEEIGKAEGFGKILGKGVYEAARIIGRGSEQYAVTTKKIGINEQGIRSHRAWALGIITSTRGSGHLGGSPQVENRQISAEVGERIFKNPKAGVPEAYSGKGKMVAWTEGMKCMIDSLGLCYFVYGWYDISIGNPYDLAEMLYLATGVYVSSDEIHRRGIRCHHMERYLSYRLGDYSRKDDRIPDRFYDTPVSGGKYQGAHLDREEVDKMLDEYYQTLGWDIETGLPGEELLKTFGLEYLLEL
jgi:aldehyde:ferredoxin oxidoreductase